jgi:hypothetical protein
MKSGQNWGLSLLLIPDWQKDDHWQFSLFQKEHQGQTSEFRFLLRCVKGGPRCGIANLMRIKDFTVRV